MKNQILNTMRLAFVIKMLAKDQFFTLAPLPEFIQTKNNTTGELDIDISTAPKDYTYKFFIAKNSNELRLGNFYAVEVINDSDRILITPHIAYEDQDDMLLNETCTILKKGKQFGCSEELFDTLKSFFEKKQ
jgi:hypothetical protein